MGLLQKGKWVDQWYDTKTGNGEFRRHESRFRHWVTAEGKTSPNGEPGFKAEKGRYHLYVSLACPWAHRTLIFRKLKQLEDYKSGARANITMSAMVASLSDQDMQDVAAYYASQQVAISGADAENIELGETLYRAGNKEISVAACTACHSPTGQGNGPAGFPSLSGQHSGYTLTQLKAFRSGERDNDMNGMMRTVVERLTDRELEAVANYVAGLN